MGHLQAFPVGVVVGSSDNSGWKELQRSLSPFLWCCYCLAPTLLQLEGLRAGSSTSKIGLIKRRKHVVCPNLTLESPKDQERGDVQESPQSCL